MSVSDADRIAQLERQVAEMAAQMQQLRMVPPSTSGARTSVGAPASAVVAPAIRRGVPHEPSMARVAMPSPSASNARQNVFSAGECVLSRAPVAAHALGLRVDPAVTAAFANIFPIGGSSRAAANEATWYHAAASVLPVFAEARGGGDLTAAQLFGEQGAISQRWVLNARCKPDLHVRSRLTDERPHRPGFNGEIKSVASTWLEQAVYYVTMDMVRSFAPAAGPDQPAHLLRFFALPPVGFALVAFPHVGYLVAVEWVGCAFVSPVSAPFVLGSAEHAAAVAALPDVAYAPPVELPTNLGWVAPERAEWGDDGQSSPHGEAAVSARPSKWWSLSGGGGGGGGGTFRKVLLWNARSAERWATLYRAYDRLGAVGGAMGGAALPPPLVSGLRLLFGAHVALVEMRALADCEPCSDEDVTSASAVLDAAAEGVALLALRHGLLYTDLRGPNVMRPRAASGGGGGGGSGVCGGTAAAGDAQPPPAAWLVDYDDCVPLETAAVEHGSDAPPWPVHDFATYREHLALTAAASEPGTFAARLCGGALPAVGAALEAAFARVRATAHGPVAVS